MNDNLDIRAVNFNGMVFLPEADLKQMLKEAAEAGAFEFHQRISNDKDDEELSTDEACKFMGVKRDCLYRFVKRHKIAFRKGKPNFYRKSELERLKKKLQVG